jgi:uncharacterized protein YeaO (DUF488 family)
LPIELRLKRVYDKPADDDGDRLLVDRLWPRGVSKQVARIDLWAKDLTPSNDLRKWFHADPSRLDEFAIRYLQELETRKTVIEQILFSLQQSTITLVTATADLENGHAAILKRFLQTLIQNRG